MANELQAFLPTGKTLYAVLLNAIGQVWDGSQFKAIASGTWTDNNIALTEATAGIYLANMPAVGAGSYSYLVYEQAGASPAVTDSLLGSGSVDWDGTAVLPLSTIDTNVDSTGIATSAALAVVDANVDAIKVKTDALDVSSVTVVTAVVGTTITVLRGDTLRAPLLKLGDLTQYVSLDFTVKESYSKTDDEATIRIRKNASGTDDGLMRLNGAAALSSALGSIAIDDLASGDITITLDETAADDLSTGTYVYDIQMISAAGVKTLTYGKVIVSADVTRLVA